MVLISCLCVYARQRHSELSTVRMVISKVPCGNIEAVLYPSGAMFPADAITSSGQYVSASLVLHSLLCTNNFPFSDFPLYLKMSYGLRHTSIHHSSRILTSHTVGKALLSFFFNTLPRYGKCSMFFSFGRNTISFRFSQDSAKKVWMSFKERKTKHHGEFLS